MQLKEICEHLAEDMADEGLRGRTLTLKLKSAATFEVRALLHMPSHDFCVTQAE